MGLNPYLNSTKDCYCSHSCQPSFWASFIFFFKVIETVADDAGDAGVDSRRHSDGLMVLATSEGPGSESPGIPRGAGLTHENFRQFRQLSPPQKDKY